MRFHFRDATEADLQVTYAITEDAMRGYVEETWGHWDADEQRQKHRSNFTPETYRIILVEEEVAGLVAVEEFPGHLWLVKLYLFSKYRGQGIGSQVLQGVLATAATKGKPVTLRVLRVNRRAHALYSKHGFQVTDEDAERFCMVSKQPLHEPTLLTGGNPKIAKAAGDAPVQAYIAAMPGWRSDIGRRLDTLVVREVPGVCKAVKWNSPFYGIAGQGWFLSFHTFTNYVKLTFFKGTSLRPAPAGGTAEEARWIDIHEDDLDESQIAAWIRQAATLPGWGKS